MPILAVLRYLWPDSEPIFSEKSIEMNEIIRKIYFSTHVFIKNDVLNHKNGRLNPLDY